MAFRLRKMGLAARAHAHRETRLRGAGPCANRPLSNRVQSQFCGCLRVRLSIKTSSGKYFSVVVDVASWKKRVSFCSNRRPLLIPPGPLSSICVLTWFVCSFMRPIRTVDHKPMRHRNLRITLALMFIILVCGACIPDAGGVESITSQLSSLDISWFPLRSNVFTDLKMEDNMEVGIRLTEFAIPPGYGSELWSRM